MRRTIIALILCLIFTMMSGCGNLLEMTGVEPNLEQKLRGIWMVGGLSGNLINSTIAGIDLYDPVTDRWFPNITPLPTPVSFAGAVSLGGKIYVIGGFNSSGAVVNYTQIYDVNTNTWLTGTGTGPVIALGQNRANINAINVSNKIYILGGTTTDATLVYAGSTQIYEFVPSTSAPYGVWSLKTAAITAVATARSDFLMLGYDDIVYFLGGRSAAFAIPATLTNEGLVASLANQATVQFTAGAEVLIPLPISAAAGRTGIAGALYDPSNGPALMFTIGGFTVLGTAGGGNYVFYNLTGAQTPSNSFQYLTAPFTNNPPGWQNAPNYTYALGFMSAALYGSTVYCFGGASSASSGGSTYTASYDISNLPAGSWAARSQMPTARFGHAAVIINQ
jgi:hypothetical protein